MWVSKQSEATRYAGGGAAAAGARESRGRMTRTIDPEGAHVAALRRLTDFEGRGVLEMGCGRGRLTAHIAAEAASVLAFDPDPEAVAEARRSLPQDLSDRVSFEVAKGEELEIEPGSYDLVFFSWSL